MPVSSNWTLTAALAAAGTGGVVLAGFVLARIRKRRAYRAADLHPGTVAKAPGGALAGSEASMLAVAESEEETLWTHRCLASLAEIGPLSQGHPKIARKADGYFEVAFTEPVNGNPTVWKVVPGTEQRLVRVDDDIDVSGFARLDALTPLPMMVSVSASTLVNLEHAGAVAVTGDDPDSVADFLRHILHELSASPAKGTTVVTTVEIAGTDQYDKLTVVDANELENRVRQIVDAAGPRTQSTFTSRCFEPAAVGTGLVGLVSSAEYEALPADLRDALTDPAVPVALLILGNAETEWRFDLQRDRLVVEPDMLREEPVTLSAPSALAAGDLLHQAATAPAAPLLVRTNPEHGLEPIEFGVRPPPIVGHGSETSPEPAPEADRPHRRGRTQRRPRAR